MAKSFLCLVALGGANLFATVSVQLTAPASSIAVGQTLTFTASAQDSQAGATRFSYQFTFRPHNQGPFQVVQDFYWTNTFSWTPSDHEGEYDIGVTAWSSATQNSAPTVMTVFVHPRLTGGTPIISPTKNALVALYSAPPCSSPARMRVVFQNPHSSLLYTPDKPCNGRTTMNFYLAGMSANTTYTAHHVLSNGASGPQISYTTGSVPGNVRIPTHFRSKGPEPPTSITYPFLLHATLAAAPYATDLDENVVWYRTPNVPYDSGYMTHPVRGGTFLTIDDDPVNSRIICKGASPFACGDHQFLREYDVAGNIIRSTSWAVVNDEVNALRATQHASQVRLNSFSHEAIRLPNGYTVTMATDEQVKNLKTGTQDVFADVVIVLDNNWQVVWAWDSFDYLDLNRITLPPAICVTGTPGCPPQFFQKNPNGQLYAAALDWTHGNSISYDSHDGNLVISFRHQSWAVKINYANGKGNGAKIWKLGFGGSFALAPGHPLSEWFSGQHDVEIQPNGIVTLFDNNNPSAVTQQPGGTARGQAWSLDITNMVAAPVANIDLEVISVAVGSAALLSNGNYEWQAGFVTGPQAQTFEFTPTGGTPVYQQQSDSFSYRSFRIRDLYTP
jgi:arylsulfate sulfotransferase